MKIKELKEKKSEELVLERDKLIKEAREFRFKKVTSVIENPLRIRNIRRGIARINTLLHLRDIDNFKKELNK